MNLETTEFFLGLDLGQKQDFSALACVQKLSGPLSCYDLRHLERLNLNMSYPAVARHTQELVGKTTRHGKTTLVVDATGVGVPVLDLLHAYGVRPVAVTITGGQSISGNGCNLRVPKRSLMRTLVALFGAGRLRIAAKLPHSIELTEELSNVQVKINRRTRHESYGARGAKRHDDLVLALALAVWYAEVSTEGRALSI
jgi:hypothetical protein